MDALMQQYHQERRIAPKQRLLMDDCTYDTAMESSASCSCYCHDDDASEHEEIYDTSGSCSYDEEEEDTTSVMLDDSHVFGFRRFLDDASNSSQSSYEEELLPTFNAMISRSQSGVVDNISAVGVLEKEEKRKQEYSQRTSVLIHKFTQARVETLAKNLDFVHDEYEMIVSKRMGKRQVSFASTTSSDCLEPCQEDSRQESVHKSPLPEPKEIQEETKATERSKSITEFVNERMSTFTRNIDFAQRQAEAWTRSFGDALKCN